MWSEQPDGSIVGGAMYLDREFDRDDNRRRLLRIHELGHALGYQHVESRTSIMNPSIGPEPTEFDRQGAMVAFARPVGQQESRRRPGGDSAVRVERRGTVARIGHGLRDAESVRFRREPSTPNHAERDG